LITTAQALLQARFSVVKSVVVWHDAFIADWGVRFSTRSPPKRGQVGRTPFIALSGDVFATGETMREIVHGDVMSVRAIAGLHVVTLAWDFAKDQEDRHDGLLGFAIERCEFGPDDDVVERYWLRGIKRFKLKDEGLPAGSPVPTSEHPVQSFQWADYTVKPDVAYSYRVVPTYGKPKLMKLDDAASALVKIRTEREEGADADDNAPHHDIFFNRGVAGSQAYARRFGKTKPDENAPESDQMKWLSRGLFEALTAFIGHAAGENAGACKLRAMLYEFRYRPVGEAFKAAAEAGADVDIRYEVQSYKDENQAMIDAVGIGHICRAQKVRNGIRHNKFIVLIRDDVPVAVWTGSTNISAGGIFGHSNVGHIVWDRDVAERYLAYWNALAEDTVTTDKLRSFNQDIEKTPEALPSSQRIMTLFSPRDPEDSRTTTPTLSWYADLLDSAKRIACMTFAFNFDPVFQRAVQGENNALSYLVFDKALDDIQETEMQRNRNTIIAIGSKLTKDDMENFVGEVLTGFNRNRYIHDKFLLVDPLGDDPIIVTGTANFSEASQDKNDENMLVIRGNTRVADIYFGEFMRIFDHHYVRYIIAKLKAEGTHDADAGYLKVKTEEWLPAHFRPGRKEKRRRYFLNRDD
jgi:phosphatidylserine/phosphatidylglycerophosphate/cardiolipin synthase-like enzyme